MSEFLRFGNTVVAVDKIVSVEFANRGEFTEAVVTIDVGNDDSAIEWQGVVAEDAWAWWCNQCEDKAQPQEQSA